MVEKIFVRSVGKILENIVIFGKIAIKGQSIRNSIIIRSFAKDLHHHSQKMKQNSPFKDQIVPEFILWKCNVTLSLNGEFCLSH